MRKFIAACSFLILMIPFASIAHPGHGETGGFTIIHYFAEPLHIFVWLSLLTAIAVFIQYKNKQRHLKKHNKECMNSL